MKRGGTVSLVICLSIGLAATILWLVGLPVCQVPPPEHGLVGAVSDSVTDTTRREFFAQSGARIVPFQILYPASAPGRPVPYVANSEPVIRALKRNQPVIGGLAFARIGKIAAPWTADAPPRINGPFPVVLYLPGVTGYMEMSSFQTAALAADGFVVVTINQPGNVAAALLPDGRVIQGMSRQEAVRLIAPSYRTVRLPPTDAARLTPDLSIIPYFVRDIPMVIERLIAINAGPHHPLYGLLDLEHVGVMGVSLGAIVAAQACQNYERVKACLMLDAPSPRLVAEAGLGKPALWLSRTPADQRAERIASGGWSELEIAAQADSIARTISNSRKASVVYLPGSFHVDFTDVPTIQPAVGWAGMAGPIGASKAHRVIASLTVKFFRQLRNSRRQVGKS